MSEYDNLMHELQNIKEQLTELTEKVDMVSFHQPKPENALPPVQERATEKEFYTMRDVAEILSLSYGHVRKLIASGQIASIKFGRCSRISKEHLKEFLIKCPERRM